jgi:hypothetical protein
MDTVVKHGSHNQASHNPHKGGTSDLPEGWAQRSRDDIRADYLARFSGQYPNDPQRAGDLADDFTDRTTEYTGPNGSRVRVELLGGGEPDAAAMRDTMEALNTCQSQVPVSGLTVVFSNAPFRDNADIVQDSTKAFVLRGEKQINMRPEYAQGAKLINREEGYSMPSAQTVSQVKYVVTHEYGHVTDKRSNRQIGDDYYALRDNGGMDALSTYGRFNDYEHLAESWAEWSLTGGSTTNPASTYFAGRYNWGTGVTKAAGDDEFERVIILDTFDPAVPPTAVKPIAKSVLVAFEPGLRPVLKHGSHDQSSHGRRGGGGSSLKLDGTVAQSIVERVRANGGLSVNMVDGSEPTKGFMVAMGGSKGAIMDADEFYDPERGPEALGSFMKSNRELSEGSYLGLWHNQADGKVYLDVSENIMDRDTAIDAGRKRDQISIWDVANFEEIDTGGTGAVGKAVAGSETAGPVEDDGRGDRRVRKDSVGEVRGRGIVVAFEPGLRPVLKHGSHDQSSHGRRGGGSSAADELRGVPGRYTPSGGGTFTSNFDTDEPSSRRGGGKTWQEEYEDQREAIAQALVTGDYSDLNLPESPLARRLGSAMGRVERRITRVAERVGIKRKKRWGFTDDEARSLRESYYEKYGRPSWMDKSLRKHLGGAHDQKSHGRGGGGASSGWGARQKDIDAMANVGPGRDVLEVGAAGGMDDDALRERVRDEYADVIEERAREDVEQEMADEGWVDRSDEPDYEEPLMGNTYQQEFDERLEARMESDLDLYVADYGDEMRQSDLEGLDTDAFNEVYGIGHEGMTPDGRVVRLQAEVGDVTVERYWGENHVDVTGTIYTENGDWAGEFQRRFFVDDNGRVAVSHELLRIDEEYQGTGFAKVFNKRAEDYYISHGITDVHVHAALDVGGFAWARQGFDWARTGGATGSVKYQFDEVLDSGSLPGSVERSGRSLRARLDLPTSDPDYPSPREVASWGFVDGAATWPGKEALLGTDWYGIKELSPSGPRRSTTETEAAAGAPSEPQIPGQQALFD